MTLRYIDLFSGLGGIRLGLEQACQARGVRCQCVLTSEIKPAALLVHQQNHPGEVVQGDITALPSEAVPAFDVLLAGFPCQAFSAAGQRRGFDDTRGTLFFEVERLLRDKRPRGFLLENVDALVTHDRQKPGDPVGRTFGVILSHLEALGYHVSWRVLDSSHFGVPQLRRRVYITGTLRAAPDLTPAEERRCTLGDILEHGQTLSESDFVRRLLRHYPLRELPGKAVKDKRGGAGNIHSWDLEMKGPVSAAEKTLLDRLLLERRRKLWAQLWGIDWMDGMPLTADMIATFCADSNLQAMLDDLTLKGYLSLEHPKRIVEGRRVPDPSKPQGYNIVTGKLSFPVNAVLDPAGLAPTLVAMDMQRLYVVDGPGLRQLTLREGLRLFGYPERFRLELPRKEAYDLLGNTVVVPVIGHVAGRLLEAMHPSAPRP